MVDVLGDWRRLGSEEREVDAARDDAIATSEMLADEPERGAGVGDTPMDARPPGLDDIAGVSVYATASLACGVKGGDVGGVGVAQELERQ